MILWLHEDSTEKDEKAIHWTANRIDLSRTADSKIVDKTGVIYADVTLFRCTNTLSVLAQARRNQF
jgi:hypothetical protein